MKQSYIVFYEEDLKSGFCTEDLLRTLHEGGVYIRRIKKAFSCKILTTIFYKEAFIYFKKRYRGHLMKESYSLLRRRRPKKGFLYRRPLWAF